MRFPKAAHLDGFAFRAGDSQGLLKGSRLDQVSEPDDPGC